MKFFKHFTDSQRGQSLQLLKQKYGWAAVGRYWALVELCAEKMEKKKDEEYTEKHCTFAFAKPYLTSSLGFANLKQASSYLQAIAELGLCSVEDKVDVWSCSMPKLLECIDRDSNRARTERAESAPKKKRKRKNKDKEEDKEKKLISTPEELVEEIGEKKLEALLKIYPQDLIDEEFPHMAFWLSNKPDHEIKNYSLFVNNWLKKALKERKEQAKKQNAAQSTFGLIGA